MDAENDNGTDWAPQVNWIPRYYSKFRRSRKHPFSRRGVGAVSALVVWSVCAAMAWALGVYNEYVSGIVFYLSAACLGWVTAWVDWGMVRLPGVLKGLRTCFKKDSEYGVLEEKWLAEFGNKKRVAWFTVGMVVFFVFLSSATLRKLKIPAPLVPKDTYLFPPSFYVDGAHPLAGLAIVTFLMVVGSTVGGIAIWLFYTNARFLQELRKKEPVPMPAAILVAFGRISDFYTVGTLTWSGALFVVGALMMHHSSVFTIVFLAVLFVLGILPVAWPQLIFHDFLVQAQSKIAHDALDEYHKCVSPCADPGTHLRQLAPLLQVTQRQQTWVYGTKEPLVILLQFVLTFGASLWAYVIAGAQNPTLRNIETLLRNLNAALRKMV